ncbi:hypothetical protein ACFQH9_02065 [Pseudonocardia lutea]|uniref:Uncharacterized protein n=1 Tax=Pseudonocardia lutea TaxID=2172015 RepID=A0ABW1I0A4_9PSEU
MPRPKSAAAIRKTENPALATELAEEFFNLHAQNISQREIAKQFGVSQATVQRRIAEWCAKVIVPKVEEYRAIENAKLDEICNVAGAIARNPEADPELRLKALDRLTRAADRRAKLNGLDAPVKADVTVHEVTQQDLELQEMLREAEAANAAQEAALKAQ